MCSIVEVAPRGSSLRAGRPTIGVDGDRSHARQINDCAVVDRPETWNAVSPSPHCEVELVLAGEIDRHRDVARVSAPNDRPAGDGRSWRC